MADKRKGLTTKMKEKDEISQIKEKTNAILSDLKNANELLDILAYLESEAVGVVFASIHAVGNVFCNLIKCRGMYLDRVLNENDENLIDRSAEEKLKIWLREHYQDVTNRLVEFFASDNSKIQEVALRTLMRCLAAEGKFPLNPVAENKFHFPLDLLNKIVTGLISDSTNMGKLITMFQEYLEYVDVKHNTMKCLKQSLQTLHSNINKNSKEITETFLQNCFSLMKLLNVPESVDTNNTAIFLCERQDKQGCAKFHFNVTTSKKMFSSMWLSFLKLKISSAIHRKVLLVADTKILPFMDCPLLLTDFLMDSYKLGGVSSLLALNGLFVLIVNHNLEFPDFYQKLYALFDTNVFFTKYRARFFFLADIFLTSTHLPEYIVAAFVKRLARMSLYAPTSSLVFVIPMIRNLLIRHPDLIALIDNSSEKEVSEDPYLSSEPDMAKCRAMESSLWEIKTLQNHYNPRVALLAKFIDNPLPKMETDLGRLLETNSNDMIESERKHHSKTKDIPVNFVRPTGFLNNNEAIVKIFTFS